MRIKIELTIETQTPEGEITYAQGVDTALCNSEEELQAVVRSLVINLEHTLREKRLLP